MYTASTARHFRYERASIQSGSFVFCFCGKKKFFFSKLTERERWPRRKTKKCKNDFHRASFVFIARARARVHTQRSIIRTTKIKTKQNKTKRKQKKRKKVCCCENVVTKIDEATCIARSLFLTQTHSLTHSRNLCALSNETKKKKKERRETEERESELHDIACVLLPTTHTHTHSTAAKCLCTPTTSVTFYLRRRCAVHEIATTYERTTVCSRKYTLRVCTKCDCVCFSFYTPLV